MWDFVAFISLLAIVFFVIWGIYSLVKKKRKSKRNFLFAGFAFVLFMVGVLNAPTSETVSTDVESEISAEGNNDGQEQSVNQNAEEEGNEEEEEVESTPQQEMYTKIIELMDTEKAFDSGTYIKGDIPAGEYAFISFDGSGQYYSEEDAAGNIIDNENFDSFGYVNVHNAGNIKNDGALISTDAFETLGVKSAKEIYQVLNNIEEDYKDSAWYKIGVDLPSGNYVIESYGEGYVAVMSGPVGESDIVNNENFNGRYQVNVSDGQYLKISGGYISE